MRRYIISHFNEPIDIASSSLGAKHAIFGGGPNLKQGLDAVRRKYNPEIIGIATTCLTETIGDDLPMLLKEYQRDSAGPMPRFIPVNTPSYGGTHMEGFHGAVRAAISTLGKKGPNSRLNLLPGLLSPADIRHLKEIMADFAIPCTILPDYSETLDGENMLEYPLIPPGGTKISEIESMPGAKASIEFGPTIADDLSGGWYLESHCQVPNHRIGLPIGVQASDRFFRLLQEFSGRPTPLEYRAQRGRLLDAYVDGHKYLSGKRVIIYGEEDLVAALSAFASEIGLRPVLCASGGSSGRLYQAVKEAVGPQNIELPIIRDDVDFFDIAEEAEKLEADIVLGNSKGYEFARRLHLPLVRLGFPIHDRIGGQRILHIGYEGAARLFDLICNTLIAAKQDGSTIGYSYM